MLRPYLANPLVVKTIELAVLVLVILFVASMARRLLLAKVRESDDRRRIRKAISIVSFLLIAVSLVVTFNGNFSNIGVSLGVASAGIAFALQSVIANAAAWLINSTGSYYKVGDRVQVGGVTGDVIRINVMVTTLMEIGGWVKADQYNGRVARVSNSAIFSAPVYNYSADFPIVWDEITVPIKYGGDRKLVVEILTRIGMEVTYDAMEHARNVWGRLVEKYDIEDAQIEPLVTLVANDNWLEYNLRYVTLYKRRRVTKSEIFTRMMDEFDQVPKRLSIASSTYDIVAFPPVDVRLSRGEEHKTHSD
tara:strand:- start:995 stop:1912 length:918 start_codon:yes stop_codon:yes gene_type:complete